MAGFDLQRVFDIAGTALNAQSVRMNTIASNLANVGSEASSEARPSGEAGGVRSASAKRATPSRSASGWWRQTRGDFRRSDPCR